MRRTRIKCLFGHVISDWVKLNNFNYSKCTPTSHDHSQQLLDRARIYVGNVQLASKRELLLPHPFLIARYRFACNSSSGSASTSITSTPKLFPFVFDCGDTGDGSWVVPMLRWDNVRLRGPGRSCGASVLTRLTTMFRARPRSDVAGATARPFSMTRCSISRVSSSSVCSSRSPVRFDESTGFTESICISTMLCTARDV
jgi:hypothetical protein